jgi:hypothetical protein
MFVSSWSPHNFAVQKTNSDTFTTFTTSNLVDDLSTSKAELYKLLQAVITTKYTNFNYEFIV